MRMRVGHACLLVCLTISLSGCPYTAPLSIDRTLYEPVVTARRETLLAEIEGRSEEIQSARLHGSGVMKSSLGSDSFSHVSVFEAPERLRIEFFTPGVYQLTAMVVVRAGSLHALDAVGGRVYRGKATRDNIERVMRIPFLPLEVMRWMVGRVVLPEKNDLRGVEILSASEGEKMLLAWQTSDGRKISAVYHKTGDESLSLAALEVHGETGQRLLYSVFTYDKTQGEEPSVPSKISFWLPLQELSGEFLIREANINPDLRRERERVFVGNTPAGSKVFDLDVGIDPGEEPVF